MNDSVNKFFTFIKDSLGKKINESGTALYSSINTIKKGKYLIVGLNPGGDPNVIKGSILQSFETIKDPDYNAYFEDWNHGQKHPLQENLKMLFKEIKVDLKSVCATNFIYRRTKRETDLITQDFRLYMGILSELIKIVDPKVIITFGVRPYNELRNFFQSDINSPEGHEASGHGNWKIRYQEIRGTNQVRILIGFPHFSRYTINNRRRQLDWFKEIVARY
jgi:hypothetical protein